MCFNSFGISGGSRTLEFSRKALYRTRRMISLNRIIVFPPSTLTINPSPRISSNFPSEIAERLQLRFRLTKDISRSALFLYRDLNEYYRVMISFKISTGRGRSVFLFDYGLYKRRIITVIVETWKEKYASFRFDGVKTRKLYK